MADITGIAAYRFVVDRVEHKDSLRARWPRSHRSRARRPRPVAVREGLRFDVAVSVVDAVDIDGPTIVDTRTWGLT